MPIKNPALYAVVPPARRQTTPAPKKRVVELRSERVQKRDSERTLKHAIDRANALFDRLEARTAAYAKEIARLQKRKALIPKQYMREKITESPDKVLINRTLTLGFVIPDPAKLPLVFLDRKGAPNETAIKSALEEDSEIPGVERIAEIPGAKLVQRISLQRK